ncbi:hypothetical protein FCOIX_10399 [Fusarium coicis]|nr:hypothetical protein FCOIX_10399 [Fusarium coicis]
MGGQDYHGCSMTHHDGIAPRLGHVFSIAAKLILNFPGDKDFWAGIEEVLVAVCQRFLKEQDPSVDAGAGGDEETEQVDETGTKRKPGDDGEGGMKKQKTGAA